MLSKVNLFCIRRHSFLFESMQFFFRTSEGKMNFQQKTKSKNMNVCSKILISMRIPFEIYQHRRRNLLMRSAHFGTVISSKLFQLQREFLHFFHSEYPHTRILVSFSREQVSVRQAQIEKLYAGLQDLCKERRKRLDETLQLYELHREIDDLLQWIADKEVLSIRWRALFLY